MSLIIFFSVSFAVAFILNKLLLQFSKNLGTRDHSATLVRWNATSKPSLGGISFFLIFLLSLIYFLIEWEDYSNLSNNSQLTFTGIICLGFFMGLADDAYNTKPLLKFTIQILCGVLLIFSGTYIQITPYLYFNYFLTILWIAGMMNSLNMLDNMDGITTSIGLTILIAFFAISHFVNSADSFYFIATLGLAAAMSAFLFFNWNPSKMFMGDTGSQFLGAFIGALAIPNFWNSFDSFNQYIQSKQFITVWLIFIVPIADTLTVSLNRISRGQSPFVGGRDHTTHNLVYNGLTERQTALLLIMISLVSGGIALAIQFIQDWDFIHIIVSLLFILIVTGLLYSTTKTRKAKDAAART
jgi:UDP-GlcNAc:undecaprenyl-phosphate GlcNAc-1-phosphate transferase